MKGIDILKSISIGILIAIFAIGLLPFLFVYSLADMYGIYEQVELPLPLFILRKKKVKNK